MVIAKLPLIAVGMLVAGVFGGYVLSGAMHAAPTPVVGQDPPGTVLAGASEPATSPCAWSDNPFDGVDADEQASLTLISACGDVKGTVQDITVVVQGEKRTFHFTILPDAAFASMVNSANAAKLNGALLVEVAAQDQGLFARLHVGERLDVQGPHVTDTDNGWNEIHPAKVIAVL